MSEPSRVRSLWIEMGRSWLGFSTTAESSYYGNANAMARSMTRSLKIRYLFTCAFVCLAQNKPAVSESSPEPAQLSARMVDRATCLCYFGKPTAMGRSAQCSVERPCGKARRSDFALLGWRCPFLSARFRPSPAVPPLGRKAGAGYGPVSRSARGHLLRHPPARPLFATDAGRDPGRFCTSHALSLSWALLRTRC